MLFQAAAMKFWRSSSYLFLSFVAVIFSRPTFIWGDSNLGKLPSHVYLRQGDISLGGLMLAHDFSPTDFCTDRVTQYQMIQFMFSEVWALNKVNSDPTILPNITLGLALVDSCYNGVVALGQALRFAAPHGELGQCVIKGLDPLPHVVGMVGPVTSASAIAASNVMSLFKIPIIGAVSSSDELSDKVKYPYFFRVLPPDRYQAQALVSVMAHFNWTYITVLYEETAYGFNGMKFIRVFSRGLGICIADTFPLSDHFVEEDYERLVGKLRKNSKSRAVVVLAMPFRVRNLFKAVQVLDGQGEFLWITGESITEEALLGVEDVAQGTVSSTWYYDINHDLRQYIMNLSPWEDPLYPWLKDSWKELFGCDVDKQSEMDQSCRNYTIKDVPGLVFLGSTIYTAETVFAFANAIDSLISDRCPKARQDKTLLANCVDPEVLIGYIRKLVLPTSSGDVRFDANGDMIRNYLLRQFQKRDGRYVFQHIGVWKHVDFSFDVDLTLTQWNDRENPYVKHKPSFPESICARPCDTGKFYIQGELPCCWECHPCRDNEYVALNGSACQVCDLLTWPDHRTLTECVAIEPSYMSWEDPYGAGLTALAAVGMLSTFIVILLVVRHRNRKVIKGRTSYILQDKIEHFFEI